MTSLLLAGVLLAAGADDPERKMTPIAPSLPAITRSEEKKIEEAIDRFILADTGRLRGEEARKATKDFERLGPEAIPALIRGLNQSAKMNHSCPILMISKKLIRFLDASNDPVLLEFARDEIGAGLKNVQHARVLQDLRFRCMLRKNAIARTQSTTRPAPKGRLASSMTTQELNKALLTARGGSLRAIVQELSRRDGKDALLGIVRAASSTDAETQKIGRAMLDVHLGRMPMSSLSEKFTDDSVEVRLGAVRVAGKEINNAPTLISRLTDESPAVRAEARAALKRLSKTEDYGPDDVATPSERREAQAKWQKWWDARPKGQ